MVGPPRAKRSAGFSASGVSASNPVSNYHMTMPGTTSGDLTSTFKSYLYKYPAVRWMSALPINNNTSAQVTFTFGLNGAGGPPTKLVYQDWTTVQHEVPFEFRDLPLP